MNLVLAFFSGVAVSVVGAVVGSILTRRRERRRLVEDRGFEIYMKLMELNSSYFWFSSAELNGEAVSSEVRKEAHDLAWQIADMLRSADEVEYLDEILEVTLGPSFQSASERYHAMGNLLERLGRRVNPRYANKIREISNANVAILSSGGKSNAPGATGFLAK